MKQPPTYKRLDEILIAEGLVSEEDLKQALASQKIRTGKLGTQLMLNGAISEDDLVRALTRQGNCEGIVLSPMEIHPMVIKMIPKRVAIARRIIPFDYKPDDNLLKIACIDPTDLNLQSELRFVARGKNIKMYIAAEAAIIMAIHKFYLQQEITLDQAIATVFGDADDQPKKPASGSVPVSTATGWAESNPAQTGDSRRQVVLVMAKDQAAVPLIRSLLEGGGYKVITAASANEALSLSAGHDFAAILIQKSAAVNCETVIDRIRRSSRHVIVQYFATPSGLILGSDLGHDEADLFRDSLSIFTSLLASKEQLPVNHSGQVGRYADKLCRRLGLPGRDRLGIVTAGYIHDLARYYYRTRNAADSREVIKLTVKLLSSLGYPPAIPEILASMYINLADLPEQTLPLSVLGGNILTMADLFAESLPRNDRLSLDKFETVQTRLRELTSKFFLKEVVESFIEMIQEEILENRSSRQTGQIMIYSQDLSAHKAIETRLRDDGFGIITIDSLESFAELYRRHEPNMIILVPHGKPNDITRLVSLLPEKGISFDRTPTYLLTDPAVIPQLTDLLRYGIEDIISIEENQELLISKIHKQQIRLKERINDPKIKPGASGCLVDLNLIDLLHALGPGRKTVKIIVTPDDDSEKLIVFLDAGAIVHAVLGQLTGEKAIYRGLGWINGTWQVVPVPEYEIPIPNVTEPNESVLMEGCRLLDETARSRQPASQGD